MRWREEHGCDWDCCEEKEHGTRLSVHWSFPSQSQRRARTPLAFFLPSFRSSNKPTRVHIQRTQTLPIPRSFLIPASDIQLLQTDGKQDARASHEQHTSPVGWQYPMAMATDEDAKGEARSCKMVVVQLKSNISNKWTLGAEQRCQTYTPCSTKTNTGSPSYMLHSSSPSPQKPRFMPLCAHQ